MFKLVVFNHRILPPRRENHSEIDEEPIVEERERMLAALLFAAGPSENGPERAASLVNALSRLP
jgi:hypothetical protein